jgi:hypothetical protein
LVDLDGDGINDVLSGSWPGELFHFRGKGNGQFEKPAKLKDRNGKTMNIGGGVRRDPDGGVTVAGDGRFEKKDGKQFIVYEDEWIEIQPDDAAGITGTASAVHAFDWDGDGDLDLLVGDIRGNVYLVPNEGTKEKWAFGNHQPVKAAGKDLRVEGDAGPFVADWDGDGKPDLLVGSGDGSVWLYRNIAKGRGTELAAGRPVLPPVGDLHGENLPAEPTRGMRSKVCVADWNGDGRPDLVVGDFAYLKAKVPDATPEQKAEQDKARAEMQRVQARYGELMRFYFDAKLRKSTTAEQRDQQAKEVQGLSQKMSDLRARIPPESENHGWVWLFLRKPADHAKDQANAGAR